MAIRDTVKWGKRTALLEEKLAESRIHRDRAIVEAASRGTTVQVLASETGLSRQMVYAIMLAAERAKAEAEAAALAEEVAITKPKRTRAKAKTDAAA